MKRSPLLLLTLLFALVSAGLMPHATVTAASERCFPETGFCISGRFQSFWEQQGGLAVFGFPVTAPRSEVNRENGQTYLTQWFERVRFELHPDQTAPYDVLLGRIGDDRLQLQAIAWQTLPRASSPQSGCLWFAETGHTVCDQENGIGFAQYWQQHGLLDPLLNSYGRSLALFGLPLSEAVVEVNPTDGKPYLTQWFERARFEWHPEQADPQYKVLLGLLGNEVLLAPQRIGEQNSGLLAARGNTAVWVQADAPERTSLYLFNADTLIRTLIVSSAGTKTGLTTDGRLVAWVETAPGASPSLRLYDQATAQTRTLPTDAPPNLAYGQLALANGLLFVERSATTSGGLFALDLNTGTQSLIAVSGRNPVAADGLLLWTETTSTGSGFNLRTTHRLMLRTLDGSQPDRQIAQLDDQNGFSRYDIRATQVVWAGFGSAVSLYDLPTGKTTTVGANAFRPFFHNQNVLWATPAQAGAWQILRYTPGTGATTAILNQTGVSWNFVGVGANAIIYTRISAQGTEEVYFKRYS